MSRSKVSQVLQPQEPEVVSVLSVNGSAAFEPDAFGEEVPVAKPSVMSDVDWSELGTEPEPEVPTEPDSDVSLKRPFGLEVVYVHPEWRYKLYTIPVLDRRNDPVYAVMPKVAKRYPLICRRTLIVPYADRQGRLSLWPILLETQSGDISSYSRSALDRVAQGAGKWCQYIADQNKQQYRLIVADEQQGAPDFGPEGLMHLIRKAFEDRVINNPEHEVLRRLRGREVR